MHNSIVRKKLDNKELIGCVKVLYQDPALHELVGMMGFDVIWTCNEHVGLDPSKMDSFIRACRASGLDSMIRIKPGSYQDVLQPLEMGASGLMIPRVQHAEEARQIVYDTKFYPLGRRGADGAHAEADFGLMEPKEYLEKANQNNWILLQLEDPESIDQVEEIAEVDGVDIIFVGPGDLSVNMGIPYEIDHPEIIKACERVQKACEKNGKTAGTVGGNDERFKRYRDMGYRFLTWTSDYTIVKAGFEEAKSRLSDLGVKMR